MHRALIVLLRNNRQSVGYMSRGGANSELAELANQQVAAMPLLQQRLAGVPICSSTCRIQHPIIRMGKRKFRHITISYAATVNLAQTELWQNHDGTMLKRIVVDPEVRYTIRSQKRSLVTHEIVHAGEYVNNCGHTSEHCTCFHRVARRLNLAHGAGVRVLQACHSMRT